MAKGQKKSNKEARKPKKEKTKQNASNPRPRRRRRKRYEADLRPILRRAPPCGLRQQHRAVDRGLGGGRHRQGELDDQAPRLLLNTS